MRPETCKNDGLSSPLIISSLNQKKPDFFVFPTRGILLSLVALLGNIVLTSCQGPPKSVTLTNNLETRVAVAAARENGPC